MLSYLYALAKIVIFSNLLTFGSLVLGVVVIFAAPVALAIRRAFVLRKCTDDLERAGDVVLLGACTVMPAWYFVMVQHTIVHANFMFRPMVWPLALLLAAEVRRLPPIARGQAFHTSAAAPCASEAVVESRQTSSEQMATSTGAGTP